MRPVPTNALKDAEARLRQVTGSANIGQDQRTLARVIHEIADDCASQQRHVEPLEAHLRQLAYDFGFHDMPSA